MRPTKEELKALLDEELNKRAEDIDVEKLRQMLKELNYLPLTEEEQKKMRQIWKNLIRREAIPMGYMECGYEKSLQTKPASFYRSDAIVFTRIISSIPHHKTKINGTLNLREIQGGTVL